jgi:hypothetical protein
MNFLFLKNHKKKKEKELDYMLDDDCAISIRGEI